MSLFNDDDLNAVFSGTSLLPRCYESHPPLKLGKGTVYGGSASNPVIRTADIYISLQDGSTVGGYMSDPWEEKCVIEVRFSIDDMHAPVDVKRFKKMIVWLGNQLQDGKTIHIGCVGGHGRTGMVLSALVAHVKKEKNAIQYVRKHYCKKAVESREQIQFWRTHYGVSDIKGTKDYGRTPKSQQLSWGTMDGHGLPVLVKAGRQERPPVVLVPKEATSRSYVPIASARSLWKPKR